MSAQGKRVIVIGGETAVGRAIAVALAEAGADVAIASLTNDTQAEFAINSAVNELWAMGRNGIALAIDASDAEQLREAIDRAEAELGAIDAAVVVGEGVAMDALGGREVIDVAPDAGVEEAVESVRKRVGR